MDQIDVLHVDDDKSFLKMASSLIQDERLNIHSANSVPEAKNKISEKQFDCILSDYYMPGKDGLY